MSAYIPTKWDCLDLATGRVYISRHVIFNEDQFPAKNMAANSGSPVSTRSTNPSHVCSIPVLSNPLLFDAPLSNLTHPESNTSDVETEFPSSDTPSPISDNSPLPDPLALQPQSPNIELPVTSPLPQPPLSTIPLGHTQTLSNLPQSSTSLPLDPMPQTISSPIRTRSKTGHNKPKSFPDYMAYYSTKHHLHVLSSVFNEQEPSCFTQAVTRSEWRAAMGEEFDALMENGTWSLCPRPHNKPVVRNKWVYKIKRRQDGCVERFKARLVAKGFDQRSGVDYHDTFSPVIKPTTIRLVLSLAVSYSWPIQQLDVSNAFLHGILDEEVYMEQPMGFIDNSKPNFVCRLHKSLYGLKQAPRAWFRRLSQKLIELGFSESKLDYSLFTLHSAQHQIFVLVYVDDILVTGSTASAITNVIHQLKSEFHVKDLGHISYFLGIQASRDHRGLHLRQSAYISDLLNKTKMAGAKPLSSPTISGSKLSSEECDLLEDPTAYRQIVGALQYCTISRPDISYAVNQLCQFMHQPREPHWCAVKRVLRYLKGSIDYGLSYTPSFISLSAFCDSDWAGSPDDRRSTSGYGVFLGRNLISWSAKKQSVVSRSSTEAEYRSMALATAELYWLRMLLQELRVSLSSPPILWCDNVGAIALASNPVFHARTKHIEVDYHFIREKVVNKDIRVRYISTHDQVSDVFTKGQTAMRFKYLRSKLLVTLPSSICGGVLSVSDPSPNP